MRVDSKSLLVGIQREVSKRLKSEAFFTDLPVVTEDIKDIESIIQQSLSKLGVCAIVATPEASVNAYKDVQTPYFDVISIVVQVVEHPTINRSDSGFQTPALEVAEHVAIRLHGWTPNNANTLVLDSPSITLSPDPDFLVYQIRFTTSAGIQST